MAGLAADQATNLVEVESLEMHAHDLAMFGLARLLMDMQSDRRRTTFARLETDSLRRMHFLLLLQFRFTRQDACCQ